MLEVFDAAIVRQVPGRSPLSGIYEGYDEVVGFYERSLALSGGSLATYVEKVLNEDDVVVALVTVKAERGGCSAAFPEAHMRRLANGRVIAFREFQEEEQAEDRFWS